PAKEDHGDTGRDYVEHIERHPDRQRGKCAYAREDQHQRARRSGVTCQLQAVDQSVPILHTVPSFTPFYRISIGG
ncbi:hypothetical protein M408DRAFT_331373, partial [Serendipita vermifera MAFF 305830]